MPYAGAVRERVLLEVEFARRGGIWTVPAPPAAVAASSQNYDLFEETLSRPPVKPQAPGTHPRAFALSHPAARSTDPAAPARSPAFPVSMPVVGLAVCLILAYRYQEFLMLPGFWAEDGPIYFAPAWNHNSFALLFKPYSTHMPVGYLDLMPRLTAAATAELPFPVAPYLFSWTAFLVLCAPVFYLLSERSQILKTTAGRLAAALLYTVLPIAPEIVCTPTNCQWIGALIMPLILATRRHNAFDRLALFVLALSGPFSIAVAGAYFAWRMAGRLAHEARPAADWRSVGIVTACAAIQAAVIASGLGGHASFRPNLRWIAEPTFLAFGRTVNLPLNLVADILFASLTLYISFKWRDGFVMTPLLSSLVLGAAGVAVTVAGDENRYGMPALWGAFIAIAVLADIGADLCARPGEQRPLRCLAGGLAAIWLIGNHPITVPPSRQLMTSAAFVHRYEAARPGSWITFPIAPSWSMTIRAAAFRRLISRR